jgi:hypothetical protein
MNPDQEFQEYRPELLSRRGELIAWGCAILVGVGWIIMEVTGQRTFSAVVFLEIFLVLAGLSISLGNWMDRKTVIRIDESGIGYQNGLRTLHLLWDQIRGVSPSQWGKRVQVIGKSGYFAFRTLGEVKVQGELKGRLGFDQGEEILHQIVVNSGLDVIEQTGEGYSYYAHR